MAKLPSDLDLGQRPTFSPSQSAISAGSIRVLDTSPLAKAQIDAGKEIHFAFEQEKQRIDTARAEDAFSQLRNAQIEMTVGQDGFMQKRGADAVKTPLLNDYGSRFKSKVEEIAATLDNDDQKKAFMRRASVSQGQLSQDILTHLSREGDAYHKQVTASTIDVETQDAFTHYNNPQAVVSSLQRINMAIDSEAKRNGTPPETVLATKIKAASNVHANVITAALQDGDVNHAKYWLKQFGGTMEPNDVLKVQGQIQREDALRTGMSAATATIQQNASRFNPSEFDRAFNILTSTESGGKQFAKDGTPLTSPKGAVGIAQVMPTTGPEAANLAGLPWDENRYRNDPNYNAALGKAYFQKQLSDFGGDLAKAYAAYNAGPGALQKAIAKAEKSERLAANDPNIAPVSYLNFLPKETQDYVQKNMEAYNKGQGVQERPTLFELENQLRANPVLAANPHALKTAQEELKRQYTEMEAGIKQHEEAVVANTMRALVSNGGRWSDLSPIIRNSVPPKEIDNLMAFGQKIAKGDDTTSLWLYNKLTNNPDKLASMSDDQFFALRKELSEADFKHFSQLRAKASGKTPETQAGDLNNQAISQTLNERLRMLSMDPTPKDGSDEAARVGAIRRFVDQYFAAAQKEAGKKFSDAEVAQHIDSLFAKNATFRGWFSNSKGPMLNMKIGDLDGATKDKIKAAFKTNGNDNPTDAQILNAYWMSKVARK